SWCAGGGAGAGCGCATGARGRRQCGGTAGCFRQFHLVGQVARHGADCGGPVSGGEIAPADQIGWARHHQPEISRHGAAEIARLRIAEVGCRILAPVRARGQRHHVAPNRYDRAIVTIGRYMVTLPACPNWSQYPASDFSNAKSSNFGCTMATNLGLMVASPADLVRGRDLAAADGTPAVSAMTRYLTDKVKLPETTSGAAALAAPSGAGGAPAAGAG